MITVITTCPSDVPPTFRVAVQVVDLAPRVLANDADHRSGVQWTQIQLVGVVLTSRVAGHTRRDERHVEGTSVRLDGINTTRSVCAEQGDDAAIHQAAHCNNT